MSVNRVVEIASRKKKMRLGAPASVRTHEIAPCALCVGNELFCTLAPDANVGGFCVLLQSRKALRSCCNLAKLYLPVAISQSFTFLLQSRKALRSGRDFCPIRVLTLLHSTLRPQRYIWRILHHVEDSCTFTFITHRCNIWLAT